MIHTRQGPPKIVIYMDGNAESALDVSGQVVGFQVSSSLTSPASSFTITLAPYQGKGPGDVRRPADLYRSLKLNQVVSIGFQEPGGITLGLISAITRSINTSGPVVQQGITISGQGIGKVLLMDTICKATLTSENWVSFRDKVAAVLGETSPVIYDLPGTWGPSDGSKDATPAFEGASVAQVVTWLLDTAPSMTVPLLHSAFGGTGRPSEFIRTENSVTVWNDGRIWSAAPASYQGNIFGFLWDILDRDFYECWIDTIPNGNTIPDIHLIIRPKPFDEPDLEWLPVEEETGTTWGELRTLVDRLPYHEIDISETLSLQTGVSDADAYSWYVVTSQYDLAGSGESQTEGVFYPCVDTYIARRFGMKKYEATENLVGADVYARSEADSQYPEAIGSEITGLRNRLVNWYRANPWYESGSVTVVGKDRYRPGDKVRIPWIDPALGDERGLDFYCTAVTWTWQYGSGYTCTLQLTRGHNATMMLTVAAIIRDGAPAISPNHLATT